LFDERVILKKDQSYPRISIVTPSFNQGQFLERTILSVLNQNYPNLEYIIIDGGSSDGSIEIIKKYSKYLSYWTSEKDKGQSNAINKGFEKSTGDILAWLNSDDIYLPGALVFISKYMEKNKNVEMVYGRCYIIDKDDKILKESYTVPFDPIFYLHKLISIAQPASFWRRSLYLIAGPLNEQNYTCMDHELFVRFIKIGATIVYIDRLFAGFRIHPASISGSGRLERQYREDILKIQKEIICYNPNKIGHLLKKFYLIIKYPYHNVRYFLSNFYKYIYR
jgi:glycosyltransferase involved in cell wall biosynthesis